MKALEALKNALSTKITYKKDSTQKMLENRVKSPTSMRNKAYGEAMQKAHESVAGKVPAKKSADGRVRPFRAPEVLRYTKRKMPY